jgi:N-acetylglucosaminyl-diphospho-decaprenol L-rhamnosyltransferase
VDLSIVVVSHGHRNLLEKYFPTIITMRTSASIEVALIVNDRRDGSDRWIRKKFPSVKVILNDRSMSYAENINRGMRELKIGRYFVVLNPDVKCLPGLWDEAVHFMDDNPDVGIMGPQLLNPDLTIQPSCRRFSTPLTLLIRGLHLDGVLKEFGPVHNYLMLDCDHSLVQDVDWVTGALMVVRREAIKQVGTMDERYKMAYSEDQDWCCRMWRGGWRVSYVPQAKAVHDHLRTGMRNPWSKMARVQLINAIRMFRKFKWKLSRF